MTDNAEEGIARTQAAAAQVKGASGLQDHHKSTIAYLDERILVFVLAICFIGLIVLWATVKSALVLYGSIAGVVLLIILWGVVRVKRIERTRQERERKAKLWQSDNPK
jgi:Flp pilus assembly protein TadB